MGLRISEPVLCAYSRVGSSHEKANNFINGYTNSEGSVEPAQMCRIYRAFTAGMQTIQTWMN